MRQVLRKRLQLVDKLMLRLLGMHDPSQGPQDALWGIDRHRDNGHIAVIDIQLMPVKKAKAPAGVDRQISAAAVNIWLVSVKRRRPLQCREALPGCRACIGMMSIVGKKGETTTGMEAEKPSCKSFAVESWNTPCSCYWSAWAGAVMVMRSTGRLGSMLMEMSWEW